MSQLPEHGLPTRHGVSPSCVGLPAGAWASMLDFLVERFPAIDRSVWLQRMAAGEVVDEHGEPVTATRPYRGHIRVYYYRALPDEPPDPPPARGPFRCSAPAPKRAPMWPRCSTVPKITSSPPVAPGV